MARRIPPLNPLRVFEVVARTQNLTAAAQELHVTQSAVSRQISALEEYLGIELCRRERHGVSITRAGLNYARQIMPAFETIANATDRLTRASRQGALRVRTYTTFAAKWLIPRLEQFNQRHPNINVRIHNGIPNVDFDRDSVDVAIQFGNGQWPRNQCDLLFHDQLEPVCSPQYLSRHTSDPSYPQSLLRHRLLVSNYRRTDWKDWLEVTGLTDIAAEAERMQFTSSLLSWQAAIGGLGLAIGQQALLLHELQSGQLVTPFSRPIQRQLGYYLVRPKVQRESRKVMVFRDWLLETCQNLNGSTP